VQVFNIIQGWSNFLFELETEQAKEKSYFCLECKERKFSGYEIIKDNEIKELQGYVCNLCKCTLSAKLRSDSKCPLNKF
jgi:predicted SprT family Zn-dependent metalloprotease